MDLENMGIIVIWKFSDDWLLINIRLSTIIIFKDDPSVKNSIIDISYVTKSSYN